MDQRSEKIRQRQRNPRAPSAWPVIPMKSSLLRSPCFLSFGFALLLVAAGILRAAPVASIHALAQREKPALLSTLSEIVAIESGSRDLEGLARLAELIAAWLKALGG